MGFSKVQKEARGQFTISAAGPVLVSSGASNRVNPDLSDACFLRGQDGSGELAYVIPGSSIKGVMRHYLEDMGKLSPAQAEVMFGRVKAEATSRKVDPVRSKIALSDAYAVPGTVKTDIRYQTAINPVSQSAKGGSLNNMEVVIAGEFPCSFRLLNYEENELEALLCAIAAFNSGELCIGGRISRGFGTVQIRHFHMKLIQGIEKETLLPHVIASYDSLADAGKIAATVGGGF